ncbi:MAG: hypothetical protein V3S39_08230 [Thermodesulfobacteriota bacterium]
MEETKKRLARRASDGMKEAPKVSEEPTPAGQMARSLKGRIYGTRQNSQGGRPLIVSDVLA